MVSCNFALNRRVDRFILLSFSCFIGTYSNTQSLVIVIQRQIRTTAVHALHNNSTALLFTVVVHTIVDSGRPHQNSKSSKMLLCLNFPFLPLSSLLSFLFIIDRIPKFFIMKILITNHRCFLLASADTNKSFTQPN